MLAAVVAAFGPAVVAWITGRRVMRQADDPALPELLFARRSLLAKTAAVAVVIMIFLAAGHGWWVLPVMLIGLLAGGFPMRRALWQEPWGLGAYLWANVRAFFAFAGPWIVAALTPFMVLSTAVVGPRTAYATAAIAFVVILVWQHWYRQAWLALMRAEPVTDPTLLSRFADVAARSRAATADAYRFGDPASAMMNAVAVPHVRRPAVAFTHTLLRELGPDEVVAVYAHETAHLEHFDTRRMKRLRLVGILLALLSAGIPLAMMTYAGTFGGLLGWIWILALIIAFSRRAAVSRKHETESDLRAVALTGDGEALVRALTALHVHARVPRRWAQRDEEASTHPSLANRIRDIRAASGQGTAPASAPLAAPVVFRGVEPGTWVALDAERAHWGSGAPADAAPELPVLRERSSSYRAAAYGELAGLRIETRGDRRVLAATDRAGSSWSTAVAPADVKAVQEMLDLVDVRFGARTQTGIHSAVVQLVAAALLLSLLLAGQFGVVLLPVALAAFRPAAATLAAAGVMALARVLLAAGEPGTFWGGDYATTSLALAGGLAAGLLWLAWRRRADRANDDPRVLLGMLGLAGVLQLASIFSAGLPMVPTFALPAAALLGVSVLGAGAALVFAPGRRRRVGAVLATLGAIGAIGATAADRSTAGMPEIAWERVVAAENGRVEIGPAAARLRAAPGGERFAIGQWADESVDFGEFGDEQETTHGPMAFLVGDFAGGRRTVRARDLAFVDDDRVLALSRLDSVLELRLESAMDSSAPLHRDLLPPLAGATVTADPSSGTWTVSGRDASSGDLVRIEGRVGASDTTMRRWPASRVTWFAPLLFDHGASLVVARPPRRVATPFPLPSASMFRHELWRVDASGREELAGSLTGFPSCVQPRVDVAGLCLANEGRRASLWRVSAEAVERVARLADPVGNPTMMNGRWLATAWTDGGFVVVDLEKGVGLRVSVPDSNMAREAVETRAGIIALVQTYDEARGRAVVVRYTVGSPAPRMAAPLRRPADRPPRG